MRQQTGCIFKVGRSWYGRWYDNLIVDGRVERKRVCRKLVDYSDRYRNEGDVQPLLNEILKPLNEGRANPQATLTVAEYATLHFFPHVEAECKPSTVNGYKALWRMYLQAGLENIALRDFRCVHATRLLADVGRRHAIGRKTLRHCKGLLSSIFTFAKQQGVLDGLNPVKDAGIPRSAPKSKPTVAATPEQVIAMLSVLDGVAKLAVALMYFTGMRPGEARGARWEDYTGKKLFVRQSVWRTFTTDPKTAEAARPVPVCETLAELLDSCRQESGYILSTPSGKPINLHNLARRAVVPALTAAGIPWAGWYSLRRGIATLATTVHSAIGAKGLLRHTNVATTQQHYIKDVPAETQRTIEKIDSLFGGISNKHPKELVQ